MTGTGCNPTATGRLRRQELGLIAFVNGHRADHRFDAFELLLTLLQHPIVDFVHPRDHLHQAAEGPHPLDQTHLLKEV